MLRVAGVAIVLLSSAGCRPASFASRPLTPTAASEGGRCRLASGQDRPLVTEWPAAEKANLESQARLGGVVVAFHGCTMAVLSQCRAGDGYEWMQTTPSSDSIEIANEDELYAKLPLGAASLKGELAASGRLSMATTVAGHLRLITPDGAPRVSGDCAGATHLVTGIAVGAYQLDGGGKTSASADLGGAVGGKTSGSQQVIRKAGSTEACAGTTSEAPDPGCSAPIQLFLAPVSGRGSDAGVRDGSYQPPPPGAPIAVQLVSAEPETTWDVIIDGQRVCTTPCRQEIEPSRSILLRENAGFLARTSRMTLNDLDRWSRIGGVQVRAHGTSTWNLSGLTRLGGLAYGLIGAGFLVPCAIADSDHSDSLCAVGGVTLGVGVVLFVAGTYLMDSPGRAETGPLSLAF